LIVAICDMTGYADLRTLSRRLPFVHHSNVGLPMSELGQIASF
jgi:hypothetical protein